MAAREMLPSPLAKRSLAKAPRGGHPSDPHSGSEAEAERPSTLATNRVGPNRVRKSLYLPTDIANRLSELTAQIHFDSRGRISKAEAAGELIRFGIENLDEIYIRLQLS
jgi:hypothetical protein